ncbi:MAG: hypothetical protein KatS3mg114_1450 [Planctomycetaceae bacterium]|nr:MAG: hypothetical protein KatS3mg114_1450 [Planctomycetaceae bacterium]
MALFHRWDLTGQLQPLGLEQLWGGAQPPACWIMGTGPSWQQLPSAEIGRSPWPRWALNHFPPSQPPPQFFTAYDPPPRFARQVWRDARILKLIPQRWADILLPGTSLAVCECPGVIFFTSDADREPQQLLAPQAGGIADFRDTFLQALELAWWLGFRRLYAVGCEFRVEPPAEWLAHARRLQIPLNDQPSLATLYDRLKQRGWDPSALSAEITYSVYHFAHRRSWTEAVACDRHYQRVVQQLRLARTNLSRYGLQLISVTPGSRLNDWFPYKPIEEVLAEADRAVPCETIPTWYQQPTSCSTSSAYDAALCSLWTPLAPPRDHVSPTTLSTAGLAVSEGWELLPPYPAD